MEVHLSDARDQNWFRDKREKDEWYRKRHQKDLLKSEIALSSHISYLTRTPPLILSQTPLGK